MMNLKYTQCDGMDGIDGFQDKNRWWILVNKIKNLRVP
jgi:hypothetical protein